MKIEEGRALDYGDEYLPEQPGVNPEKLALKRRMREFVQTAHWKDVQEVINMCLGKYKVPRPTKEHERYGYEVYNLVRDALSDLAWEICNLANDAEPGAGGGRR